MFSRRGRKLNVATNFKCKYGKFRHYNGKIYTKIGEGMDENKGIEMIFVIDPKRNLITIPKNLFEGKTLIFDKGFVQRFEQTL